MGKKNVLIIGATGMIGGKIVKSFLNNNFHVKILTRDKQKARKKLDENYDFFEGDVLDKNTLVGLFKDIDGVYVHLNDFDESTLYKTFVEGVGNIVELAKFHKVNRFIFRSASIVREQNKWFPSVAARLESEKLIRNSKLEYTILKPGYFMEVLKFFLRGNQASIIGEGKNRYNWLSGDEYADEVIKVYNNKSYTGETLYLFGPEALRLEEALQKYCNVLKPNARFNSLTHDMMWSISRFSNNKKMGFMADFIKFMDSSSDNFEEAGKNDNVLMLASTIDQWLEQYVTL